jgi:archaellum component FlaC
MGRDTNAQIEKEISETNKKIDSLNTQIGKLQQRLDVICHEVNSFKSVVETDIQNIVKFLKEHK